jgi:dTDP-4-dehydrorhamnose 3,5-epimerase
VLRSLHYQIQCPQGKLVRVVQGQVFDGAVDLRQSSATFGQWVGVYLDAQKHQQFWVPPSFAHGFVVLSESAEFLYKTTDYWYPAHERSLRWDDPLVGIVWPMTGQPLLAAKDAAAVGLAEADKFALRPINEASSSSDGPSFWLIGESQAATVRAIAMAWRSPTIE